MAVNKYFKKGDIIYIGIVGMDKLICKQLEVFDTEGFIRKEGESESFPEEGIMQRIFIKGGKEYVDIQVDGEEFAISKDKQYIIDSLNKLKGTEKWPIYYEPIKGRKSRLTRSKEK